MGPDELMEDDYLMSEGEEDINLTSGEIQEMEQQILSQPNQEGETPQHSQQVYSSRSSQERVLISQHRMSTVQHRATPIHQYTTPITPRVDDNAPHMKCTMKKINLWH
jgi:hypothetical protein